MTTNVSRFKHYYSSRYSSTEVGISMPTKATTKGNPLPSWFPCSCVGTHTDTHSHAGAWERENFTITHLTTSKGDSSC